MRRPITLAAMAFGAAAPAFAQASDGEWTAKIETTVVVSDIQDEDALAPAGNTFLGSALLQISRSDSFDNGLTLSWLGGVRFERDAATRPAFTGALGACPAGNPVCPGIGGGPGSGGVSPVSAATGLAAGGVPFDEDGFVAIEYAAVTLSGPWGEGELGYDSGAAARLDARAPMVLKRVTAFSPGLDPTGLGVTRARNDVTGSSAKATYLSPRWLGLRLGASYTPEATHRSADFDPDVSGPGLAGPQLEQVWEGGVSFARQFAEQGLRVRAAVTYTSAESGSVHPEFGSYEAVGAGLELEHDGWTGGVRWLSSNNAWAAGNGDYEAWEVGIVKQVDGWRFGAEAGKSEDRLNGLEGSSWLVGVRREISHNLDLGIAWSSAEADIPIPAGLALGHRNASNGGLLVELSVRN